MKRESAVPSLSVRRADLRNGAVVLGGSGGGVRVLRAPAAPQGPGIRLERRKGDGRKHPAATSAPQPSGADMAQGLCRRAGGGLRGSQLCPPPADALLAELEQSSRPASMDYTLLAPSSAQQDTAAARPSANCSQKKHAPAPPKVTLWGLDKWAKAPKILLSSRWWCPRGAEGHRGHPAGSSAGMCPRR